MASVPHPKSKRADSNMHTDTDIVRSEIWLEDGNVVLQAEGTQFKLHRGTLSLNSTVFKDMFSLPQATFGEKLIEGCPIVHLSDSAADVLFILQALFQRRQVILRCYYLYGEVILRLLP